MRINKLFFELKMPQYDETFIHDDNLNQRKNKRSYRVYKQGLGPISLLESSDVLHALEERGTSVIKRNIRNIKYRSTRTKLDATQPATNTKLYQKNGCKGPDIIIDHCPSVIREGKKFYDKRNNNVHLLTTCKSLDNLALKRCNHNSDNDKSHTIRNGVSLQNLLDEEKLKHYGCSGGEYAVTQQVESYTPNFYSVVEPTRGAALRRPSGAAAAPGPGIYRQINGDTICPAKKANGMNFI